MENMEYPKMVMQATVIGLILLTICVIVMAHLERKFREMLKPKHNSKAKPLADKEPEVICETEKKDWAIIGNCDMSGYNFERKTYTNTYFINVNFTGSNFKNATFMHCNFINCNMDSAQILNTEIYDCVIKGCDLMTANFDSSNFTKSKIENCNMKNSCFSFAVFFVTDIADCDMDEDDFTEVSFYKASISDCQMNKAILDEVTFCEMVLERCDLANAYGSVLLAGIDSKIIDCKHVALCTDAVKLEVFDNDELTATSYKTALFS